MAHPRAPLVALLALVALLVPGTASSSRCPHGLGECGPYGDIPFLERFPLARQQRIHRVLSGAYAEATRLATASPGVPVPSSRPHSLQPPLGDGGLRVFKPVDFGADPTGVADSSAAFAKTVASMFRPVNASSAEPGDGGSKFADLGGAVLDLDGGKYALSAPVQIPGGFSNFQICGGMLVARNFSGDTLLAIGTAQDAKGSGTQNLAISRLTLDGNQEVGTMLFVHGGQYVNIGPAMMVYGFTVHGIAMNGTGGGYIHDSWLGEQPPWYRNASTLQATAISLEGDQHDCYITDCIIWSGKVGVRSMNGANELRGVHTWNLQTGDGGIGILMERGQGKVVDSYLDFCPLVIYDPKSMVVDSNLFLAKANLVLRSGPSQTAENVVVTSNRFSSEMKYTNVTVFVDGDFTTVLDVKFEDNVADKMWQVKSTRATQSMPIPAQASGVQMAFAEDLVFPLARIQEASCSIQSWEPVQFALHPFNGTTLFIGFPAPVTAKDATITCTVDQSKRLHAGH